MTESTAPASPKTGERLLLLQWHIDRYDRLRSSTSSRAAVLLSANAALLAGTIILANSLLQNTTVVQVAAWLMRIFATLAIVLSAFSVASCTNAVAAWRTTRRMHAKEIPNRFAFNWGDTLRSVDGFSDFANKLNSLKYEEICDNAAAELWTAILQHKRRHKYLRHGIHAFRASALIFLCVAAVVLFFQR